MKNNKMRILTLFLALALLASLFAGCEKREDPSSVSSSKPSSTLSSTPSSEESENSKSIAASVGDQLENVKQHQSENADSVGWLKVPFLPIDDVVLWSAKDNFYYERLNFYKAPDRNGVYYADFRQTYAAASYTGLIDSLDVNTVIYGHAMDDDPENIEKYKIKFGPLHNLRDPEFAADVPYIYYSTSTGNYVYEVFANFVANADNAEIPYNDPTLTAEQMYKIVKEQVLPRSILDYDVTIQPGDKFLTLSTCIYRLPGKEDQPPLSYPNNYRYAIMARLVTDTSSDLKETVAVSVNEDILIDPAGLMSSKK